MLNLFNLWFYLVGWDQEFTNVHQATLFEMILVCFLVFSCFCFYKKQKINKYQTFFPSSYHQAANFLDIKPMLDLTCKTVAEMIKGKSVEEIRKHFNIKNDFTPEEEAQVRKENEWAEDRP